MAGSFLGSRTGPWGAGPRLSRNAARQPWPEALWTRRSSADVSIDRRGLTAPASVRFARPGGPNVLSRYRVIDLTEGGCLLAGQILADLGADVIQVEPPGGSSARSIGPFHRDRRDPERSLHWWAYGRGKRSLDARPREPRRPGDPGGLSAAPTSRSCRAARAGSIAAGSTSRRSRSSIRASCRCRSLPSARTARRRDWAASDLVSSRPRARSSSTGDDDRPPVRVSVPQAVAPRGRGRRRAALSLALQTASGPVPASTSTCRRSSR